MDKKKYPLDQPLIERDEIVLALELTFFQAQDQGDVSHARIYTEVVGRLKPTLIPPISIMKLSLTRFSTSTPRPTYPLSRLSNPHSKAFHAKDARPDLFTSSTTIPTLGVILFS